MDMILYIFGAVATLLFLASVYQLRGQISSKESTAILPAGHSDQVRMIAVQLDDPAYDAMAKRYNDKIVENNSLSEKYRKLNFGLSFAVTALSAAATLTTAINVALAKSPQPPNPKVTIIVASITFVSTLTNFLATYFNGQRTDVLKNVMDWTGKQARFFAEYDAAPTAELKQQVIERHKRDFSE